MRNIGPVIGHSGGDLGIVSDVQVALKPGRIAVAFIADADGDTRATFDA